MAVHDPLAADLHALVEHLDLHDAVLVGHSMGTGEVARYLGRYGSARAAEGVLMSPIPLYLLQTPDGLPQRPDTSPDATATPYGTRTRPPTSCSRPRSALNVAVREGILASPMRAVKCAACSATPGGVDRRADGGVEANRCPAAGGSLGASPVPTTEPSAGAGGDSASVAARSLRIQDVIGSVAGWLRK